MSSAGFVTGVAPPTKSSSGRRWSNSNSRQVMKDYDHSPVTSPNKTPVMSRTNSSTSVNSTKSEPGHRGRHHSAPDANSGDINELRHPRQSVSRASVAEPPTQKKGLRGLFHHEKDPLREQEKEKKRKAKDLKHRQEQTTLLMSKHAAEVRVKMIMDPAYREHIQKHVKPKVKTAGYRPEGVAAVSASALQEMRYPHSGPATVHGAHDLPGLTRIESHDEPDQPDQWEMLRKEWNEAKEHNLGDVQEIRSRAGSRVASPIASREPSPSRSLRPGLGSGRNSYAGGYTRDSSGRWTRKTPPEGHTPPLSVRSNGGVNPDTLAASLAERLNTSA